MITTYHTATGSIYEVDDLNKLVRRMQGMHAPTPREGQDGIWKQYDAVVPFMNGLLIVWDETLGKATLTSQLVAAPNPS